MKREYGALWLAWALTWLAFELSFRVIPWQAWIGLFAFFLALELTGARREKSGDTLSEGVWKFVGGRPARGWMGRALAAALALRFFSLPSIVLGEVPPGSFLEWGPTAALALGLFLWLNDHFPNMGANG